MDGPDDIQRQFFPARGDSSLKKIIIKCISGKCNVSSVVRAFSGAKNISLSGSLIIIPDSAVVFDSPAVITLTYRVFSGHLQGKNLFICDLIAVIWCRLSDLILLPENQRLLCFPARWYMSGRSELSGVMEYRIVNTVAGLNGCDFHLLKPRYSAHYLKNKTGYFLPGTLCR